MGRYPAQPLEEKLAWMRERQAKRQATEVHETKPSRPLTPEAFERRERLRATPRMLRIAEVAKILGVSRQTVRREFREQAVKLRGCVLIPEQIVRLRCALTE